MEKEQKQITPNSIVDEIFNIFQSDKDEQEKREEIILQALKLGAYHSIMILSGEIDKIENFNSKKRFENSNTIQDENL